MAYEISIYDLFPKTQLGDSLDFSLLGTTPTGQMDTVSAGAQSLANPINELAMAAVPTGPRSQIGIPPGKSREINKAGLDMKQPELAAEPRKGREEVNALVQAVADPASQITKLELPSGVKIESTPPAGPRDVSKGAGQLQQTPTPGGEAFPVFQPEQADDGSFMGALERMLKDPRAGYVLGKAAQAVTAADPRSFGFQLGGVGAELSQANAYEQYVADLATGQQPGEYAQILSPEQKDLANRRVMAERKMALDENNAGVQRAYTEKLTSGVLTAEEKQAMQDERIAAQEAQTEKQITAQKDLQDARLAVQLELGHSKNKWMSLGKDRNLVFNWETREVRRIAPDSPADSGGTKIGDLNAAMYKQFQDAAVAEFLPEVFQKYEEKWKERGWATAVEMKKAFTNPQTGAMDYGILMSELEPEDQAKFAKRLSDYTVAQMNGIPYTAVFAGIMDEKLEDVPKPNAAPKPGEIRNGYKFKGGNPNDPNSWEEVNG